MFLLVTIGKWHGQKEFERRVKRALGHRGYLVGVSSGPTDDIYRSLNRELQVASTDRWILWWHPSDEWRGGTPDVARLVRSFDPLLQ